MDLRAMYDGCEQIEREISAQLRLQAADDLQYPDHLRPNLDYRLIQAAAAAATLHDYLADRIAHAVAAGELEPDPDD